MSDKRLVRSQENRMLFGVCAGLANYLNIDPVIVRLITVLLTLWNGIGLLLYLILIVVMPREVASAPKANAFDDEEIIIKEN